MRPWPARHDSERCGLPNDTMLFNVCAPFGEGQNGHPRFEELVVLPFIGSSQPPCHTNRLKTSESWGRAHVNIISTRVSTRLYIFLGKQTPVGGRFGPAKRPVPIDNHGPALFRYWVTNCKARDASTRSGDFYSRNPTFRGRCYET